MVKQGVQTRSIKVCDVTESVTSHRPPAELERSVTILCARGWRVKCLFITNGMGRFNGMSKSGEA